MRKFLLSILLTLALISSGSFQKVNAISCSGNRYSVDTIDGDDVFTNIACFALSEYQAAFNLMNSTATLRPNVILTYYGDNPNTPATEINFSKIVAADRAMAYSQNLVYTNSSTMNIYANSTLSTSYTYMDDRNQLFYYGTYQYNGTGDITPSNLSALISVNGAKGYVKVNQIQIIPLIYVDMGWTYDIDTDIDLGTKKTITIKQAYYIVGADETIKTKNGSQVVKQLKLIVNFASTSSSTYEFGLAPNWLSQGTYYSPDGITFYYDVDLKIPVFNGTNIGKYYNYYALTNLRSKSNYSGSDLDTYLTYYQSVNNQNPASSTMTNSGAYFINAQNTYGMNALMIYSMGAHESAYGRSNYAQNPANLNGLVVKDATTLALLPYTVAAFCLVYPSGRYADELNIIHYCSGRYNLFGWGANDSNPDNAKAFVSIEACVKEHMGINLRRNYMSASGSYFYASNIGNKGAGLNTKYASDPWWSTKISQIAYRIDRYLGFTDLNTYQFGILNSSVSNVVYKDLQLTTPFYSIASRATNYPFIILEGLMVNGTLVYKVQTTNPINEDGTINNIQDPILIPFDFSRSIGYISATQISDYISKFVTGVVHLGLYNSDRQIFFTTGTATLNGAPIASGVTVSTEGTYEVIAISTSGVSQTIQFTIDKTAPIITINTYSTLPTNQDVVVTASVNEGSLVNNSHTFTQNGTFVFVASDAAGNQSEASVEITNIDKTAPIITLSAYDGITLTSQDITVSATTNEGTLNVDSHTFLTNGSFNFTATDAVGNTSLLTVTITNIVKQIQLTYNIEQIGGTLSASIGASPVLSGSTINSTDIVTFNIALIPPYRVYRWLLNDLPVVSQNNSIVLDALYLNTQVNVEFLVVADLNGDNKVSTTDLVQLRRYVAGLDNINEKAVQAADVNGDGRVSTTDLVLIRRMLAGLE